MRTLTLAQPFAFESSDTPHPGQPGPGEALLRVHSIGVCGTDLHGYRGKQPFFSYPRILGHELGVEVIAIGTAVTNVRVGDRCAVQPYIHCGTCIACRNGKTNCCATLKTLGVHIDGGMRDEIVLPASLLHPANDLDYDALALVETLCIGGHAVSRAQPRADEWVLVIGAGPIGLSVIEFVRQISKHIIVLDVSQHRLTFCKAKLGITHTLLADANAQAQVGALTGGDLPTVVFDATGNAASMANAVNYVAPGGRLVFVGLVQADIAFNDPFIHRREITLYASRNATAKDFAATLEHIRAGRIDTRPWVTHVATPDEAPTGFAEWILPESGAIKAVIHWA